MWLGLVLVATIDLIELHGLAGQRIFINTHEITSVREPVGSDRRHYAPGTACLVVTVNGNVTPVREACDEVLRLLKRPTP